MLPGNALEVRAPTPPSLRSASVPLRGEIIEAWNRAGAKHRQPLPTSSPSSPTSIPAPTFQKNQPVLVQRGRLGLRQTGEMLLRRVLLMGWLRPQARTCPLGARGSSPWSELGLQLGHSALQRLGMPGGCGIWGWEEPGKGAEPLHPHAKPAFSPLAAPRDPPPATLSHTRESCDKLMGRDTLIPRISLDHTLSARRHDGGWRPTGVHEA